MVNIKKNNIIEKYNLPKDVKFCKRCVVSNQRPRISFDEEGICSACRFSDHKNNGINWAEREEQLAQLCDKHRSLDGSYDVIVPSSGGKDSNYVAYMLKNKYNMHPLLVTWSPQVYTELGRKNLTSVIDSGFDSILITANGEINRKLTKAAFISMGDPHQSFIYGQFSAPFKVAIQYKIPLVFYGEDTEVEYGGSMEHADRSSLDYEIFTKHRFSSLSPSSFENYGFNKADLEKYGLSEEEIKSIKKLNIKQYFFGYFKKWVPQENVKCAIEHTGFEVSEERSEGTYSKDSSLDNLLDGFHYYLSYIKFGLGRCISDAAHEVRDGYMTRDEAIRLVKEYDGEFPKKYYQEFLDYCDISEDEFNEIIDSWRSDHIWKFVDNEWQLKNPIWLE